MKWGLNRFLEEDEDILDVPDSATLSSPNEKVKIHVLDSSDNIVDTMSSVSGTRGGAGENELVFQGKQGKGKVVSSTIYQLSPPLMQSALSSSNTKIDEIVTKTESPTLSTTTTKKRFSTRTLKNHLIICDYNPDAFSVNIIYFIAPFRQRNPDAVVVILSPCEPPAGDREVLEKYGLVYFLCGSPFLRNDLDMAGVDGKVVFNLTHEVYFYCCDRRCRCCCLG